jgi:hypothetical protein
LHTMANFFYKSLHLLLPYTVDRCIKMRKWIMLSGSGSFVPAASSWKN